MPEKKYGLEKRLVFEKAVEEFFFFFFGILGLKKHIFECTAEIMNRH